METNTRLKTQTSTSTPKINGIDMLANARPLKINKAPNIEHNQTIQPANQNISTVNTAQIKRNIEEVPRQQQINTQAQKTISKEELIKIQQAKFQAQALQKKQLQEDAIRKNKEQLAQQNIANQTKQNVSINVSQHDNNSPLDIGIQDKQNTLDDINDIKNNLANMDNKLNITQEMLYKNPNAEALIVDLEKLDFAITKKVRIYLKKLISIGGSDLHLKAGGKIRARINGDIVIFGDEIFTKDDAITFAKELVRTRFPEFVINKEMDITYIYDSTTRFRVNLFFQTDGVSFAFRRIPTTQSTISELGLPDAIHKIVDMERGLVLVTGITGSGKSTTLAAIINEINHNRAKHIITIEDPIEFIHKDAKSMINQRSVGMDTNSFAGALKAALREDPDIILVGEMRDIETIEMALHAAETGHLVLSTLHTLDAKETINRIISVFPAADQVRIRATLASVLNAVISQRLMKSKNGGRVAAIELLFKTPRIELIISEGRDGDILEALAEGKEIYHTQTFDQHLFELIINGIVDEEIAMEKATSPSDLKLRLQNVNVQESDEINTISIKQ